jgi:hypothetical protein
MQINKKILLIMLSMSLHGAIMSMEEALREHAENLSHYMSEENSKIRKQNILPFAQWITEKRATFSVDNNWKAFCENNHTRIKFTIKALPLFKFPGMENITPDKMLDVIMDRTYKLQPSSTSEALTDNIDQDLLVLYHACFKS